MKTLARLLALFALTASVQAADITKPIASLRMPDGRVLLDVLITKFNADNVVVKHRGGVQVVLYTMLPADLRAEAEKRRPGGPRYYPGDIAANATTYSGQVFVQTRGYGPYKFGNVAVYAFPIDTLAHWESSTRPVRLGRAIAETKTDGDGKFTLNVPSGTPFFIFAQARRLVGPDEELTEWRVPNEKFREKTNALLTGENSLNGWSRVEIDSAESK